MSVTTTQKNTNFQSTPLQDVAKLTDVPGVGAKSAEKLLEANIDTPIKLMGNFMVHLVCCPCLQKRSLIGSPPLLLRCAGRCEVLSCTRSSVAPEFHPRRCCALAGAAARCGLCS